MEVAVEWVDLRARGVEQGLKRGLSLQGTGDEGLFRRENRSQSLSIGPTLDHSLDLMLFRGVDLNEIRASKVRITRTKESP